jgi:hypothetical protein
MKKPTAHTRHKDTNAYQEPILDEPADHEDHSAMREVLEHAARFLLVRDQESADKLRAGLVQLHIIKE